MKEDEFRKHLNILNYTTEDVEESKSKVGDYVRVVSTPHTAFPETLLTGLVGEVVGFDVVNNRWEETYKPRDPLVLVLLPINNLGVYTEDELVRVNQNHRPLYVGFSGRLWGLITQALRRWSLTLELDLHTHKLRHGELIDRLKELSKGIEWQILRKNIHNGLPVDPFEEGGEVDGND